MRETIYNDVETPREPAPPSRRLNADVDWLDLAVVLSKHRKQILKATLIGLVLSTIVAIIIPAKYTAKAQVLPPSGAPNIAAMIMGSMANGTGAMGGAASNMLTGAMNLKNPSDIYVAMLKSRTVADAVIKKFDLRKNFYGGEDSWEDARKRLEKKTDIGVGKEGVITIEYDDRDPERARAVAQEYIDQLFNVSGSVAVSEASQRRIFFDKQLLAEKDQLTNAEIELKKVQQATGLIVPSEQARASIEGVARVRAMISAKEVQIAAMQHFASSNNPELQQAQQELGALRAQLSKLERGQPGPDSEATSIVAPGKVPESSLEFIRKYRDFKYHETIYELLAKQLELARLDEAKDYAALQILDVPVKPDKRSKPDRAVIILIGTLFFMAASSLYWIYFEKSGDPDRSSGWQRWEVVKSYWQRGGAR
jgi:uncharacterized protein involved in exopolysaccharide biosynthesis